MLTTRKRKLLSSLIIILNVLKRKRKMLTVNEWKRQLKTTILNGSDVAIRFETLIETNTNLFIVLIFLRLWNRRHRFDSRSELRTDRLQYSRNYKCIVLYWEYHHLKLELANFLVRLQEYIEFSWKVLC